MEHSATFARLFARLVWLLINDGENVDEQKMALRAVVAIGRHGAVRVRTADGTLYANNEPMLAVLPGVSDLARRMAAGRLAEIEFERQPAAGEMLGLARALALVDSEAPDPAALESRLEALGATTLRFVYSDGRAATPPHSPAVLPPGFEPTQDAGTERAAVAPEASDAAPMAQAAAPTDARPAPEEAVAPAPGPDRPSSEEQAETAAPEPAESEASVSGLVSQDSGGMFFQFSSMGNVKDSPETLLERLRASTNPGETIRLLDDVVTLADTAAREGKPLVVVELLYGVIEQEGSAADADVRRAFVMALRRLSKPLLLRGVAGQLVAAPERRHDIVAVLVRMERDGAEALIDQVAQAQTSEDRRVMFEVLQTLDATEPALVHMLGDARWFVARNAADLLGDLRAAGAEPALVERLRHDDERVRRSATNALMQLGTESARQAVREAVRDSAPQVRMQAAFAIAAHRDQKTATTLITAIDAEQDSDVQLAMLLALGRVGTVDAVERLIKAAEPERGFFKKKSTAFRVAAVQALAEVGSPAARAALKSLASDKEKEVRDTVARLSKKDRRT